MDFYLSFLLLQTSHTFFFRILLLHFRMFQFPPFYDSTMSQNLESESQGNQLSAEGAISDTEPVLESTVQSASLLSEPASQDLEHQDELRLEIPGDDSVEQKSVGGSDTAATSPVSQSDTSSGSLDRSAGSSKISGGATRAAGPVGVRRQDSFYESDEDARTPHSRRKSPGSHVKPDVERPPGYESAIASEEASPIKEQKNHISEVSPPSPAPPSDRPEELKQSEMRTAVVNTCAQPLPSYEEALSAMTEPTLTSVASAAPIAKLDSTGSDSEQVNLVPTPPSILSVYISLYALFL